MKASYEMMCMQLANMNKEEINTQLKLLNCPIDYDKIAEELKDTYNELSVSDHIFDAFAICNENSPYDTNFIDEAVIEIAKRESYPVTHYCIISTKLHELNENHASCKELEEWFEKLFHLAKKFNLKSLEGMVYDVNDGVNMYAIFIHYLSNKMEDVVNGKAKAQDIIQFVDRYFRIFSENSSYLRASFLYEQAKAYMLIRSTKGEAIFESLFKEHEDLTEVVYHYALALSDTKPKKAIQIINKYADKLDSENTNYELIEELKKELK